MQTSESKVAADATDKSFRHMNGPPGNCHLSPPEQNDQANTCRNLVAGAACRALILPQQLRQLRHIGRNPPRLIAGDELSQATGRAPGDQIMLPLKIQASPHSNEAAHCDAASPCQDSRLLPYPFHQEGAEGRIFVADGLGGFLSR
jgi:hypothetical protein